ncbi:hypothetical protein N656DRAFT_212259 [Canariomyces notabilis]|uniref:Uncharacterized protein n=1 Tax=Canariomyces notabilis TaxID=2074819 RepID=A0AAN6T9V9_9PEZI|nr:hypothetical protein N656DRAFT_212259 [Canariomyces arenarius]
MRLNPRPDRPVRFVSPSRFSCVTLAVVCLTVTRCSLSVALRRLPSVAVSPSCSAVSPLAPGFFVFPHVSVPLCKKSEITLTPHHSTIPPSSCRCSFAAHTAPDLTRRGPAVPGVRRRRSVHSIPQHLLFPPFAILRRETSRSRGNLCCSPSRSTACVPSVSFLSTTQNSFCRSPFFLRQPGPALKLDPHLSVSLLLRVVCQTRHRLSQGTCKSSNQTHLRHFALLTRGLSLNPACFEIVPVDLSITVFLRLDAVH